MYITLRFKRLREAFCPASVFLTADRDEARNRQYFIYVTVVVHLLKLKINAKLKTRNTISITFN